MSFLLQVVFKNRLARDVMEGLWIAFTMVFQASPTVQLEML